MSSFDERARDWDTPERVDRANIVATAIRQRVRISPTARAIDIGAGTGLLGLALAGDVREMVLAEPSRGMLEITREKLERSGITNVSVIEFDLTADEQADAPFDLAVSLLVLHHVPDTAAALSRIAGLLRPGGWLALADLDTEDGSFHDADATDIHHKGFDRERLRQLASEAGFTEISFSDAATVEREGRDYVLFLLTARRSEPAASSGR